MSLSYFKFSERFNIITFCSAEVFGVGNILNVCVVLVWKTHSDLKNIFKNGKNLSIIANLSQHTTESFNPGVDANVA